MFLRFWKSDLDIRNSQHKSTLVGEDELRSGHKSILCQNQGLQPHRPTRRHSSPPNVPHHQVHSRPLLAAQIPPTQPTVHLSAPFLQ